MKKQTAPKRNRRKTARYRAALKAHRHRTKAKSAHGKRLP
jgi:hypothetical protein